MSKSLSDFISIYKAHGRLDGEMVKAFLEANGIQTILSQEAAGSIYGLSLGDLGAVDLLVDPADVQKATALLNDMNEGKFIQPDYQQLISEDETEKDD